MSNGAKMPKNYRQQYRKEKRDRDVAFARRLGCSSRHLEDPEGSARWVQTGRWV